MYAQSVSQSINEKINTIVARKGTNLVLSLDLPDTTQALRLVDQVSEYLMGVKIHSDIYEESEQLSEFIDKLCQLAIDRDFIIIDDRKFSDIGNTVELQSENITFYADLVTVHGIPGPGVLEGLRQNCIENGCGVLLIAEMSSQGTLIDDAYTQSVVKMAQQNRDIVVGFISQQHLEHGFRHFTPGVRIGSTTGDDKGQQYRTPECLIDEKNTEFLIVGRGIYESPDPVGACKRYVYVNDESLVNRVSRECVLHGEFTLKSGQKSDVYIDLRRLWQRPELLWDVAKEIQRKYIDGHHTTRDTVLVGVPMGALPLVSVLSVMTGIPMIVIRKEAKDHGTGKRIEGPVDPNKKYVIIEDVITTGGSVREVCDVLVSEGITTISQVITMVDRSRNSQMEDLPFENEYGAKWTTLFFKNDLLELV